MGYTTLLNIQRRSYRIYYLARDRLEKRLPGGVQYDNQNPMWKNIPNKSGTQSPRHRHEKWGKKRRTRIERKATSWYIVRLNADSEMVNENLTKRARKFLYVPTLLIGPHPNFKQVRNSDLSHGAHRDVDRRIKRRTFAILESHYYFLPLPLYFLLLRNSTKYKMYQTCTKQL